jgi:hypothetical protein
MRKTILFVSFGALLALVASQTAFAAHPHNANPNTQAGDAITFTMVPAFKACTAPNTTHGAPLGAPSCTPANESRQTSPNITTGKSPAGPYKGRSSFKIDPICNPPAQAQLPPCSGTAGDQEDVKLTGTATDIRCKAGIADATKCGNENGAPAGKVGDDYVGNVQADATIQITDAFNGPPGFTQHGTVVPLPFPVNANCVNTADATIGATCSASTSADTTVPNVVKEGKQANVEIGQLHTNDGGPDGQVSTANNSVFAVQGIYIP